MAHCISHRDDDEFDYEENNDDDRYDRYQRHDRNSGLIVLDLGL